jgi:glycosyltransferase involved in cell wall biosynthesis
MVIQPPAIAIAVMAHNEEKRIVRCLESLPLATDDVHIHVVVNGSTDRTAERARDLASRVAHLTVHEFARGGKSRNWNRFVFDTLTEFSPVHIFVDGDAHFAPGSVAALADALARDDYANAAAGMPLNGRSVESYRRDMKRLGGMFGDLYALRGCFLAEMKAQQIRLPDDLVGDDSLLGSLAKTNLGRLEAWDDKRINVCEDAGFFCDIFTPTHIASWQLQYRRMVSYSVRHFQNLMIRDIMNEAGPAGLPPMMADIYARHLPALRPRPGLIQRWFDRTALSSMAASAQSLERP